MKNEEHDEELMRRRTMKHEAADQMKKTMEFAKMVSFRRAFGPYDDSMYICENETLKDEF